MRTVSLLMAGLTVLASAGTALARPDTRAMSCAETQALIERAGAIVLTTGQHTYDRYVARNGYYCSREEVPVRAFVPTQDVRQCLVYRCELADDLFNPND